MRSAPFFSKGKAVAAAASVLLLMMAFLSLYKSNLCPSSMGDAAESPPQARVEAAETTMSGDPLVEPPESPPTPEVEMHRALTEQTRILQEISRDVDSVNQSLDEITVLLQEQPSR
jgi:hypothetical protein